MNGDDERGCQSLVDLFREEAETQTRVLASGLLTLEQAPTDTAALEACMRAAHSLKGGARIIDLQEGVIVAHCMEECFVAAQRGELALSAAHIDELLGGVDLLLRVGATDAQVAASRNEIDAWMARLEACGTQDVAQPSQKQAPYTHHPGPAAEPDASHGKSRMLRVHADHLDKLLSLSGESLVEARWLQPFTESMLRVKRTQREAARALDLLHETLDERLDAALQATLDDARRLLGNAQQMLSVRIDELDRRNTNLAQQLYDEALQCRMRPFGDAGEAYPRIVRDFARSLNKRVRFAIEGEATQVDRDILDMLDTPLGHLLRNALDHGVETPDARVARGKSAEAHVTLVARHSAGKLLITVSDDGAGIDPDELRATIVKRRLADEETASRLSDQELLDFLLLPGFSMREHVTEVSGRGVGLDAVHEMVKAVHGTIKIFNDPGRGMRFVLKLPLTLSLLRGLIVEVDGEAYAFPLAQVHRTLEIAQSDIDMLEGLQHFTFEGRPIGLVAAHQLLGRGAATTPTSTNVAVVLIGDVVAAPMLTVT